MIKDSTTSSSRPAVSSAAFTQSIMIEAIERLKNGRYIDVKILKKDILCVHNFIGNTYTSTLYFLAAKYGLVEAIARAIILLHRFNELDAVEPILQKLHTYYHGPADQDSDDPSEVYLDMACSVYCTGLDKKFKGRTADILFKKQRLLAMIEYVGELCKTSKKLSTAEAKNAFEKATNGIGSAYPVGSTVQLVPGEKGKLTLVVKPPGMTAPLYFEL
ncbi:hypothetical protein GQ42DRAFT_81308 [Ramicandelaber brevisporus]|nr:hypothetical protein GQ42DRAFT_81308 [Ramicandelaber brevisporus]